MQLTTAKKQYSLDAAQGFAIKFTLKLFIAPVSPAAGGEFVADIRKAVLLAYWVHMLGLNIAEDDFVVTLQAILQK